MDDKKKQTDDSALAYDWLGSQIIVVKVIECEKEKRNVVAQLRLRGCDPKSGNDNNNNKRHRKHFILFLFHHSAWLWNSFSHQLDSYAKIHMQILSCMVWIWYLVQSHIFPFIVVFSFRFVIETIFILWLVVVVNTVSANNNR